MTIRSMTAGLGVIALIGCMTEGAALAQQAVSESWTAPRAPDGKPDLQGIWDLSLIHI